MMAPAPDTIEEPNALFQFINSILKRDVIAETKNETNLEIGDKIQSQDGKFKLEVNTFGPHSGFPVTFEPKGGEDLLDDHKITKIDGDFHDESAEYVLRDKTTPKAASSNSTTTVSTTTTVKTSSKPKQDDSTISTSGSSSTTTSTTATPKETNSSTTVKS